MSGSMKSITAGPVDIITGPLEKHYPVSAGNDHRVKENVEGKAAEQPVYAEPVADAEAGGMILQIMHSLLFLKIYW